MNVYLNNAATTQTKPECVYTDMDEFMRNICAISGRSANSRAIQAGRIITDTRERLAALFGISDSSKIVFTLNCTEALNLAIKGLLQEGDHVISTPLEHNSVMRPLNALVSERNITLSAACADASGITDPDSIRKLIRPETRLIVMTHASNVCGAIQPVEECGRIAREHNIPLLVDAAQTAGHLPIDLERMNIDMLAFSGHKGLMGPQGVGALCMNKQLNLCPLKQGGTGSRSSEEVQPEFLPDRFESGTPNTPGIAGLGAALEFILKTGVDSIQKKITQTSQWFLQGLESVDGLTVYGPDDMARNIGVFAFRIKDMDPATAAMELEERFSITTRAGLQCAPSAHRLIGTFPDGTVRASIGYFTTREEIEYTVKSLQQLCRE